MSSAAKKANEPFITKNIRRKTAKLIFAQIIILFFLFIALFVAQVFVTTGDSFKKIAGELDVAATMYCSNEVYAIHSGDNLDLSCQNIANSVAFALDRQYRKNAEYQPSRKTLEDYTIASLVTNIVVVEKNAEEDAPRIISSAVDFDTDLSKKKFDVLFHGAQQEYVQIIDKDNNNYIRYYSAEIRDGLYCIVELNNSDVAEVVSAETNLWEQSLEGLNDRENEMFVVIDDSDGKILYHPDEESIGLSYETLGIEKKDLGRVHYNAGFYNKNFFSYVTKPVRGDSGNYTLALLVPFTDIIATAFNATHVLIILFFFVFTLLITFGMASVSKHEKLLRSDMDPEEEKEFRRDLVQKMWTFSVVAMLIVGVGVYCVQMLFLTAREAISNTRALTNIAKNVNDSNDVTESRSWQYDNRHLSKVQLAAKILSDDHSLWNRKDLEEFSRLQGLNYMMLFDQNGKEIVSDSTYVNYQLPKDPKSPEYPFRKLMIGAPYVIGDVTVSELDGNLTQNIGAIMTDKEGNTDGFLIVSMYPDKPDDVIESTSLSNVIENYLGKTDNITFAVDAKTKKFVYHPNSEFIGDSITSYGLTNKYLRDKFTEYLDLGDAKYLCSSVKSGDYYYFTGVPKSALINDSLGVTIIAMIIGLFNCVLIFLIILGRSKKNNRKKKKAKNKTKLFFSKKKRRKKGTEDEEEDINVDVTMPSGEIKQNITVNKRWANPRIAWDKKTPGQQTLFVLRIMFLILAVIVCIAMLNASRSDVSMNHMLSYILSRSWKRGFHIFSLSCCFLMICAVYVALTISTGALRMLMKIASVKGETILRLISDFLKYIAIIGVCYQGLSMCGVPAGTLLTSAGILSLALGIGANKLIGDVFAGLFIITEGDFQVGDIISIGSTRGTVQEIGIRTTKILDGDNNIQIINNSSIGTLVNMTQKSSDAIGEYKIRCDGPADYIEKILAEELSKLEGKFENVLEGPEYSGIREIGPHYVKVRVHAKCNERDRFSVTMVLNREMKRILAENGMTMIPDTIIREINDDEEPEPEDIVEELL